MRCCQGYVLSRFLLQLLIRGKGVATGIMSEIDMSKLDMASAQVLG